MILKKIVILFALYFSHNAFTCESSSELSDYGWFPSPLQGCQGQFREISTQYNNISSKDQGLWKIHDDNVNPKNEYNALNIHTCHVLSKGSSFKFLITKLEIHPNNKDVDPSLYAFLSCLVTAPILFNSEIIYAWIPKTDEKNLLKILTGSYHFKKSKTDEKSLLKILTESYHFKKSKIKLKDSDGNKIRKPKDTIQLKVSIDKLTMIEINTWLQAQLYPQPSKLPSINRSINSEDLLHLIEADSFIYPPSQETRQH